MEGRPNPWKGSGVLLPLRYEYEMAEGRLDGKGVCFSNDGGRWEVEYRKGKQHRLYRSYDKDGTVGRE